MTTEVATRSRTDKPETIRFNIYDVWPERLSELLGLYPDTDEGGSAWQSVDERYFFDFGLSLREWAQMDTTRDAAFYGHWCNPWERAILSYVEGDIEYRSFPTREAWAEAVREWVRWAREAKMFSGIDIGVNNPKAEEVYEQLGLTEFRH